MSQPDLLATRLNFDATVFCGCTLKEMKNIVVASLIFNMIWLGLITKALFGLFLVGIGLAFPMTVATSWVLALILQRFKQGKPNGYVKQQVLLGLERNGLMRTPYVTRSGHWSVRRY